MKIINFTDIETTGINEPDQRIIEYCGMWFDLATERHIKTVTQRFNPLRKIEAKAQKVHGISLQDLASELTWDIGSHIVHDSLSRADHNVAHNGGEFDFPFLEREFDRIGNPVTIRGKFDTMSQARWATPYGKNPRLGELAMALDIPYDPTQAHGAEYDVSVMAKCFFEGRRLGWFVLS